MKKNQNLVNYKR